jgi:hypothetical protein
MSKRAANKQISQLDPDDDEEADEGGGIARADPSVLAGRKIRSFKRPSAGAGGGGKPLAAGGGGNPFAKIQLAPSAGNGSGGGAANLFGSSSNPFAFGGASAAPAMTQPPPTFSFGGAAPATPATSTPALPLGLGMFAQPTAPTPSAPALAPVSNGSEGSRLKQLVASTAPLSSADYLLLSRELNAEFAAFAHRQWKRCSAADWSKCVSEYVQYRKQLDARKPAGAGAAPAAPAACGGLFSFGGGGSGATTPAFGAAAPSPAFGAPKPAQAAMAAPPKPAAAKPAAPEGDGGAVLSLRTKLNVYRQAEGEWRDLGVGYVRLVKDGATHFLEFRPEVSDQKAADDDDPQSDAEGTARLGRVLLSARLLPSVKPEATGRRLQVILLNAINNDDKRPASYSFLLKTPSDAQKLATEMRSHAQSS